MSNSRLSILFLALIACVTTAFAVPTLSVTPPTVEYGCAESPPNDRCIITLSDSTAGDQILVDQDTVPVGETRTVQIARELAPGEKVVVTGSFVGLTATGRQAPAVSARDEGVFDPQASPAVPFLVVTVDPK